MLPMTVAKDIAAVAHRVPVSSGVRLYQIAMAIHAAPAFLEEENCPVERVRSFNAPVA